MSKSPVSKSPGNAAPVFLVDDDPDVRDSMKMLLELDGYTVETAGDGEQALDKLREGLHPCLILLDLMMPRMDGFEFRNQQLRDPQLAQIPVIVYSGHYDAKANAQRLGASGYFEKPVNVETVLKLVQAHCVPFGPH